MGVFSECQKRGHEEVAFLYDPECDLKAIVALHSTALGPAVGGCRLRVYNSEEAAVDDVLRLSEGMTYKNALAGIPHGGGKSCIILSAGQKVDRQKVFTRFGEFLNRYNGLYYAAEDMGTNVEDMAYIRSVTDYVVGNDKSKGGSGDPSPWTAYGIFSAIKAALAFKNDTDDFKDVTVAIQGVGHVGFYLAEHLVNAGARVVVADTNQKSLSEISKKLKVETVAPDAIYDVDSDIFAPCAVGQTISKHTLSRLKCSIIAGAANNQLSDSSVYGIIEAKEILYCPDFVINAGGVISVAGELEPGGWKESSVKSKVDRIEATTLSILEVSRSTGEFPEKVALRLAREKVAQARAKN